jgi:hypothetical protein
VVVKYHNDRRRKAQESNIYLGFEETLVYVRRILRLPCVFISLERYSSAECKRKRLETLIRDGVIIKPLSGPRLAEGCR